MFVYDAQLTTRTNCAISMSQAVLASHGVHSSPRHHGSWSWHHYPWSITLGQKCIIWHNEIANWSCPLPDSPTNGNDSEGSLNQWFAVGYSAVPSNACRICRVCMWLHWFVCYNGILVPEMRNEMRYTGLNMFEPEETPAPWLELCDFWPLTIGWLRHGTVSIHSWIAPVTTQRTQALLMGFYRGWHSE